MASSWELRAELFGHSSDVRGLCVAENENATSHLVSASRDSTVRTWAPAEGENSFVELQKASLTGHKKFVGPVVWIPAGKIADAPNGAIVSGGFDGLLVAWDAMSCSQLWSLQGHTIQISALATMKNGCVVSASLDNNLKVWRGATCLSTLQGHSSSVLSVVVVSRADEDGVFIISGSSDKTIRIWSWDTTTDQQVGRADSVLAHNDSVRALACDIVDDQVISASHDGSIKVWRVSSGTLNQMLELQGHQGLIYAVTVLNSGLIVSGSEDNTMRIWNRESGAEEQRIEHPGCVWDVCKLDGDVVSACSDGAVRIWTQSTERMLSMEEREKYHQSIAERKQSAKAGSSQDNGAAAGGGLPAGVQLLSMEALTTPGKKDGEIKVVNEDNIPTAYSWNQSLQTWEKIGQVVEGPSNGGKKTHEGKEYDFVFDVDVEDGAPPLKLPYNIGDDPYDAADRFLTSQNLPMSYREQVVQFIIRNSGSSSAAPDLGSLQSADPFTGQNAYGGSASSSATTSNLKYLPKTSFILFDTSPNFDGLRKKMFAFNQEFTASEDASIRGLAQDPETIENLISRLQDSDLAQKKLSDGDSALISALLTWPAENLFPVLDVCRFVVLSKSSVAFLQSSNLADKFRMVGRLSSVPNLLTASRFATNLFAHNGSKEWLLSNSSIILESLSSSVAINNRNLAIALASLALNASIFAEKTNASKLGMQCLSMAMDIVRQSLAYGNEESLFRALVCVGNLICSQPVQVKSSLSVASCEQLLRDSLALAQSSNSEKLSDVVRDLKTIIA